MSKGVLPEIHQNIQPQSINLPLKVPTIRLTISAERVNTHQY